MTDQIFTPNNPFIDEEMSKALSLLRFEGKLRGHSVRRFDVTEDESRSLSVRAGRYVTVTRAKRPSPVRVLADEINSLMGKACRNGTILVVGIGNPYMVADSLGPLVVEELMQKRSSRIKLFTPHLEALTGISSFDAVSAICSAVMPSCVIVVDALCSRSSEKIGASFQMSDAGIAVGSAVGEGKVFDLDTLGRKVIAIGVPTVVNSRFFAREPLKNVPDALLCPKNIDEIVKESARIVASGITKALE